MGEARIVIAVQQDAIGKAGGIDDRRSAPGADQRKRFANDHVLLVGTAPNVDQITARSGVYRGLNRGITKLRTPRNDTKGGFGGDSLRKRSEQTGANDD